jgi:hypothetical protein
MMKKLFNLIPLLILMACMPEQAMRAPVSVENGLNNTPTTLPPTTNTQTGITPQARWFDNGSLLSTLTLNVDNLKAVYLFGDDINLYLSQNNNFAREYCAIVNFQATLDKTPKQYRVRIIPQVNYNNQTGTSNRYFRVNTNLNTGHDICNRNSFKDAINTVVTYNSATTTNAIDDICFNCLNIFASTSVELYQYNSNTTVAPDNLTYSGGFLQQIKNNQIAASGLTLRIDMNNNSVANTPTCTNANCQAQGFNCCLQGQCVMDGGLKNTRAEVEQIATNINNPSYLSDFDMVEAQKVVNPLLYLQYPQYYYICLESAPSTGGSTPLNPQDPAGDARKRLIEMISDFYCVEELKANSPSNPFHTDPYDASKTYNVCKTNSTASSNPNMFYQEVMKRMYQHCGCSETNLNNMVSNCPRYTYKAVYNGNAQSYELSQIYSLMTTRNVSNLPNIADLDSVTKISRIECVSPEANPNILPFANMNVVVNSKSAPHRFFDKNLAAGNKSIEITDVTKLPTGASGIQEGDAFQYLDNQKVFPLNGAFNMNSILGPMNVNLSEARPARMIQLEFDKMYYIATLQGYFTPCPSCSKDSWFPNFLPHPSSSQGVGLQSFGYTTKRDAWGTNSTFGNYEDTIFGRACWLPPTMIPFSHHENTNVQNQRLNRLKTQAAYFVNGYQRDWFGFNKGALIGSFDGVTWFAVGKGRVVRATTDRLYLAINAPFADLTQHNDHTVTVQQWDFMTTGAQYDYDPDKNLNSPLQNSAGLCQRHHSCETDSDCITQLGWEYVCADVNQYVTKWPRFSVDKAEEIPNDSKIGTIVSFLQQGELPPGTSSKKCVYRGAGAPCRKDYNNISDSEMRKALACAPNFYCANVSSGNVFNREVARFAGLLEDLAVAKNHFFGQDANHLGRPLDYMSVGNLFALPNEVQTSINSNLLSTDSSGNGDFGLCRPGKSLPNYMNATATNNTDFIQQQKAADPQFRTDYISQISGCNSALYTNMRYSSCPILDETGNYIHLSDDFVADAIKIDTILPVDWNWQRSKAQQIYGHAQNSCGMEALSPTASFGQSVSADTVWNSSAFKSLEGRTLASAQVQYEPTLARDACYRKPGSVCHTDLDCAPNYKHADLIDIINPNFFGNEAERKYWQEYFVCGQGEAEPTDPKDPKFLQYKMGNNRCCREVGKDMSMFSEDMPGVSGSTGLQTHKFAGYHPNDPKRYSRFSNLNNHGITETTRIPDGNFIRPSANTQTDANGNLINAVNILNRKQWKTINSSGKRTCCGGGWIRKFADGTNNWQTNRLNLDVANFRCLSFNSPLVNTSNPAPFGLSNALNNQDSQNLCFDATKSAAGCTQQQFGGMSDNSIQKPTINTNNNEMFIYTWHETMGSLWQANPFSFFTPFIYDDGDPLLTVLDWGKAYNDDALQRRNLTFRVPSFITWPNHKTFDNSVSISLQVPSSSSSDYQQCEATSIPSSYNCGDANAWHGLCSAKDPISQVGHPWQSACPSNGNPRRCCYVYNPANRILKVAFNYEATHNQPGNYMNTNNNNYTIRDLQARFRFTAPGTLRWESENAINGNATSNTAMDASGSFPQIHHRRSSTPGNAYYYLKRLENLELIGIPQISYQPLYCSDNYQRLVPNLFKSSYMGQPLTNIVEFNNHVKTFLATNSTRPLASEVRPFNSDSASVPANISANSLNQPYLATQELLNHEPIFSSHDFKCCMPLGKQVPAGQMTKCCSGFAAAEEGASSSGQPNPNQMLTCKLPPNTDLNVYYNKFVSSEGMDSDDAATLTEDEFDEHTGYPIFTVEVMNKLKLLAKAHCSSKDFAHGGAFGPFVAEPHGSMGKNNGADANRLYSILDSIYDEGSNNNRPAGYVTFEQGRRWNHHVYCAPEN